MYKRNPIGDKVVIYKGSEHEDTKFKPKIWIQGSTLNTEKSLYGYMNTKEKTL